MLHIYIYDISSLTVKDLTFILLTWRKWWAPNNASRQQMGFNSGFKGLICATIIYFVTEVLSEQWSVAAIAELSYIVEGNSGREMMTAGGKLLCNCSMPYCMCYSVNKVRKIILFQLTFKPEQWRCRRTHVCMKTRNVSRQFFSTFNIITNIMQFTCASLSGDAVFYCHGQRATWKLCKADIITAWLNVLLGRRDTESICKST